ncbi:UNKNOWN [Stylonychia lemnae]|uniref:Dickkopf N-terminal cysteine-rich domain-containing protein n=1 Tax=Stylonychia lemnae TaxID=5949 RepID=A0A078A3B7_STYLE|nr:UNKNOWN [Stylonychia lemnae]|eukprot:CDW76768.1 UNKNOWN [Stylonychia lemnae]
MKIFQSLVIIQSVLVAFSEQQQICPALTCDSSINYPIVDQNNICFQHSADSPVTSIRTYSCNQKQQCGLVDGEYAWTRAIRQNNSTQNRTARDNSQVYQRITEKTCEDIQADDQLLQNGRKCELPIQCISRDCDSGKRKCVGKEEGQSCESHQDCDINLACLPDSSFPFKTTCKLLKGTGESCLSDYECLNTHFCWPPLANSSDYRCLEMYSQDFMKDYGFIRNTSLTQIDASVNAGRYCKSGVALIINNSSSRCIEIVNITSTIDNHTTNQSSPYLCSLTNNASSGCRYWYRLFNQTVNRVLAEDYCECSLQPALNSRFQGICPFPGQDQLSQFVKATRILIENTDCHTLDRYSMIAQNDCGAGGKGGDLYDQWAIATETLFNLTYWPFIQSNQTNTCMQQVMTLSRQSIDKSQAYIISLSLQSFMMVLVTLLLIQY